MNIIQINQLTKKYNTKAILKGVDLQIQKGEVFGFVGHNGAGKSTFIHTITGILNNSSGNFKIAGIPDQEMDQIKGKIGVMPDVANLYEQMRGFQFLRYMGKLKGDTRNKLDYETLMQEVGLENASKKKIKAYSFGMKKKISIAQALLGNPNVIILDEPTSGLDPESAIHIRNLILDLQNQGKTILLTSHNLDEVDKISDRVAILSDGIIKKSGTPQQLKKEMTTELSINVQTTPVLQKADIQCLSEKLGIEMNFIQNRGPSSFLKIASEEQIPILAKELMISNFLIYGIKIEENSLEEVFLNA